MIKKFMKKWALAPVLAGAAALAFFVTPAFAFDEQYYCTIDTLAPTYTICATSTSYATTMVLWGPTTTACGSYKIKINDYFGGAWHTYGPWTKSCTSGILGQGVPAGKAQVSIQFVTSPLRFVDFGVDFQG